MSNLPTNQTCQYGSFDFGNTCKLINVEAKVVPDPSGRISAYTEYIVTLSTHILASVAGDADDEGIDDVMDDLRPVLMQRGQTLRIVNAGFGDFQVNSALADVRYGPEPLGYRMEQVADRNAWELTWKCKVSIAGECLNGVRGANLVSGPIWFVYDLQWFVDKSRYSRRTYTCELRIAGVLKDAGQTTLADQADRLREKVTPQIPIGFQRISDQWTISQDKLQLNGTIVDEQLPVANPLPEGVISCSASASSSGDGIFPVRWANTLEATYEMAPGKPRASAVKAFFTLLYDRMIAVFGPGAPPPGARAPSGPFPFLKHISLKEPQIYGKTSAAFAAAWWYTIPLAALAAGAIPKTISSAFTLNGLWRPVPGGDWGKWARSVASVMGPRGQAGLTFNASDDILLSMCSPSATPLPGLTGSKGARVIDVAGDSDEKAGITAAMMQVVGLAPQILPPESSFLAYDLEVFIEPVDDVAVLPLLPSAPVVRSPSPTDENDTTGYKVRYVNPGVPTHIIQNRAYPSVYITLRGMALRAGYEITPPEILKVGGVVPVPCNHRGFNYVRSRVAGWFSGPVVASEWCLTWVMSGVPTGPILTPDNPILGAPTTAQASQASPAPLSGFITTTDQ